MTSFIVFYLVNGMWGSWSEFTECDAKNMKNRTRSCDNPASKWGGLDCLVSGTNDTYDKEEMDIVKCREICPSTAFIFIFNESGSAYS